MTVEQKIAIQLLKSAITGEPGELPNVYHMGTVQNLMLKQGVITMGYIGAVNNHYPTEKPLMIHLLDYYCCATLQSERQLYMIDRICSAFEENGFDYMPVKGAIMKHLYPNHELRGMSDADILIREEQYPQIRAVMTDLGFEEVGESDHEHIWSHDHLTVELHKRLMPTYNKDYYSYFGVGWDLAKVQNGHRWSMTHEDAFIYDFIHFAKHYRDGEGNCRFVVDLWIHMRSFPDLDMDYIRHEMVKMHMGAFYDNIMNLIKAWFYDGPWDEKTERITEVLFSDDEQKKEANLLAKNVRSEQNNGTAKRRKLQIIFPDKEHMRWSYPKWKKIPLPIAWVLRWFDILLFRRNVIKNKASETKVTQAEIDHYRKDLEYVGLEFSDGIVLPD